MAFRHAGFRDVSLARVRWLMAMGGDQLLAHAVGIDRDSDEGRRIVHHRAEVFRALFLTDVRPCAGMRNLLERMTRDGLKLVVVTSSIREEVPLLLAATGLSDLIDEAVAVDDGEPGKGEFPVLTAAVRRSGSMPDWVVVLGDSPHDLRAANAAGLRMVGLVSGSWPGEELRGATAVYRGASDLLRHYKRSVFALGRPVAAGSPWRR
jgi:phosphoglycolate phosphatase-like HAD superfamily hydrolase